MYHGLELIKSPPDDGTNSLCNDISFRYCQYNTVDSTSNSSK